jgi:hypothetical protein
VNLLHLEDSASAVPHSRNVAWVRVRCDLRENEVVDMWEHLTLLHHGFPSIRVRTSVECFGSWAFDLVFLPS